MTQKRQEYGQGPNLLVWSHSNKGQASGHTRGPPAGTGNEQRRRERSRRKVKKLLLTESCHKFSPNREGISLTLESTEESKE